MYLLSRS